jgi:hypothetical protein
MSMGKSELIQRCRIRITETKQAAIQKMEDDFGAILKFLGDEALRIEKEELTNGVKPLAEAVTKVEPDRE